MSAPLWFCEAPVVVQRGVGRYDEQRLRPRPRTQVRRLPLDRNLSEAWWRSTTTVRWSLT